LIQNCGAVFGRRRGVVVAEFLFCRLLFTQGDGQLGLMVLGSSADEAQKGWQTANGKPPLPARGASCGFAAP
jgi:hypothetical protein